ncbi:MAG: hypothetical protein ACE5D7_10250, partial [Fidelibacterota bacterium]
MKKILFLLIFSFPFSQWSNSPDSPLTLGSGIQPQIASCTDGSVYIAWLTESTFHVFLQKIDPEGN